MRRLLSLLVTSLALLGQAGSAKADTFSVEILNSRFGVLTAGPAGEQTFLPTLQVPYTPGRGGFGWMLLLDTRKSTVLIREELELPEKPQTWGVPETKGVRTISADGRTATTEREVHVGSGLIQKWWQVAPGDPKGRHALRIYVDGRRAATFDFEIR